MATKMCFAVGSDMAFEEIIVEFEYIKGMSFSQKQKNVLSFHKSIKERFPNNRIIEISTKSQSPLGVKLSAFNLKLDIIKELLESEIPRRFGCSFGKFSELNGSKTNSGIIFTILAAPKKENNYDAWTLFNRLNKELTELQIGTYFAKTPPSLEGDDKDETWSCVIKSYAREFKDNQRQLLVATKAFGMGIDKPNIRYVIHNSLSNSIEQYYQEVGRAGRDRAHSECVMLFSNSNDRAFFGNINRDSVLEKYLIFVDGCSRGRADDEKMKLEQVQGDDLHFIFAVIGRYVDLVYGTIEKGRRRALHSMFRLAKEAVEIHDPDEQDKYIREKIQYYLVKDDTVDLVKSSDRYAGIYEILNAYPLYPNDVIIDSIEQENAKKTSGYATRMLDEYPDHPGLLYLRAITSIKSRIYNDTDIVKDIVAAYKNSESYSIPADISTTFLVKIMNLTFNSSCELFDNLWDKIDDKAIRPIFEKATELSEDDINEHFKKYLILHIATHFLRKMIGEK